MLLLLACNVIDDLLDKGGGDDTADSAGSGDTVGETAKGGDNGALDPGDELCDEALSAAAGAGPDCLTDELACGGAVRGTTEGGSSAFDGDDYTAFFCFTNLDREDYLGTERVYAVDLEPDAYATLTFLAPCTATSVAIMAWPDEESCPIDLGVAACEGSERLGGDTLAFGGYGGANRWIVVVDTPGATPANFELSLACD